MRFQVTLGSALDAINALRNDSWLEDQIRTRHSYRSFQDPDNIAEAIRLVSDVQLWEAIASELNTTSRDARTQLRSIVDRRNQIAHESDVDPSYAGGRLTSG